MTNTLLTTRELLLNSLADVELLLRSEDQWIRPGMIVVQAAALKQIAHNLRAALDTLDEEGAC